MSNENNHNNYQKKCGNEKIAANRSFIQNTDNFVNFATNNQKATTTTEQSAKLITKTITAVPQGITEKNTFNEQRGFHHSQFTATGIFVTKGSQVTVKVKTKVSEPLNIFIGQWGVYQNLNQGQSIKPHQYLITSQSETITADIEGMLYLTNNSEINVYDVIITVTAGYEIPTFLVGTTTNQAFATALKQAGDVPFVEIISKNLLGTFQMQIAKELWIDKDPSTYTITQVFNNLDHWYELSNTVHGLGLDYDGIAHKFHNKIQIATPDSGAGYAFATNYYLGFNQDTGAGKVLFIENASEAWYIWHEIGHTYQNPNYEWANLGEVTVNINSLWIQRELGYPCRLITDGYDQAIKKFVQNADIQKSFDDQDVWVKLGLFWQLDQAYGKWFYPTLNQTYRLLAGNQLPANNFEKQQLFIQMTAKLVKQNLIPFFEKWGIFASDDTKKIVSQYPNLTKPIWNNIFDGNYGTKAVIEHLLPAYMPVAGVKVVGTTTKNVGNTLSQNEIKQFVTLLPTQTITNLCGINYQENSFLINHWSTFDFVVSETHKTANKYHIPVELKLDYSILLAGMGYDWDQYRAIINLNHNTKTFFIGYNQEQLHYRFTDEVYNSLTISDANGQIIFQKTALGQDTGAIYQQLNTIKYQENYRLEFNFAEPARGMYYQPNQGWIKGYPKLRLIVQNDQLILNT